MVDAIMVWVREYGTHQLIKGLLRETKELMNTLSIIIKPLPVIANVNLVIVTNRDLTKGAAYKYKRN